MDFNYFKNQYQEVINMSETAVDNMCNHGALLLMSIDFYFLFTCGWNTLLFLSMFILLSCYLCSMYSQIVSKRNATAARELIMIAEQEERELSADEIKHMDHLNQRIDTINTVTVLFFILGAALTLCTTLFL